MRLVALVLATVVVGSAVVGVVSVESLPARAANDTAGVEGTPHLNSSAPNARLNPGQNGAIGISITNDATYDYNNGTHPQEAIDRAGEARSVRVDITDTRNAPITVETGQQAVGTIQDGETSGPHNFNVVVDEDAEAGTYEIEVTERYRHAKRVEYEQVADGEYQYNETVVNRTETSTVTVVIEPQARFEVTDVNHDVPLGGEGIVSMDVKNTGDEDVTESTVSVTSSDSNFYFGSGTATSEASVGEWNAGETKTLQFRAGTVDSAVQREYPIDVSVSYTDSDDAQQSGGDQIGITPRHRTDFDVVNVTHDVPRSGEGTLTVTVNHTADKNISDVAVTASTSDSEVYLGSESSRSATTFVGEWNRSDRKTLTFRVGTTDSAINKSYPIELQFDYTDEDDNDNTRSQFVAFTPVTGDRFEVQTVRHDVPQSGEGTFVVNVTQITDKSLSDVTVTASTSSGDVYLGAESSRSATTALGSWDPDQSRRLTFRVGTTDSAINRSYPIELQFDYTDEDDNDNSRTRLLQFTPDGRDHFAIEGVSHNVPRDGTGTVTVDVRNDADQSLLDVTATASTTDSEIYIGSDSSRSGTATVDQIAPGETRPLTFRVGATANAVNRTYPLDLEFQYTDARNNDNQQTEQVAFRPRPEPQFRVASITHDAPVGGAGQIAITMRNTGPVNATDASVSISSEVDAIYFGTGGTAEPVQAGGLTFEPPQTGTPTSSAFVGDWPVGENRTIYYRLGFDQNAIQHDYTADLTVNYENGAGDSMPAQSTTVGVEPVPEPRFGFERVESDLYVGEEGNLVGRVTNNANRTWRGVIVSLESDFQSINFYNPRYAIGTLEPGESETFRYRVGVTEEAEHGPRLFELSARYRDPDGAIQNTDSQDMAVQINPDRNAFAVESTGTTFAPGESGELVLTVTNRRNETVSDVQAKLFTDDPLDSEDDSAFVPELEPGESTTVKLDLAVAGSAMAKDYSVSMDFRYDNARGESVLSDTYRVPVIVQETESGIDLTMLLGAPVALVAVAVLGWRFGALDRLRERLPDDGVLQRLREWYTRQF